MVFFSMGAKAVQVIEFIKFSHSVFALPFALGAMVVAAKGWPDAKTFGLIVAAMVTARSAAMAFNRIADAEIDVKNPRTQNRHLPQGILSKQFAWGFTLIGSALFLLIGYFINPMAFALSPLVLIWLLGYSFTKRFTWLTHLWLGVSLGLAPLGAWIAVTGNWPWPALSLGTAVTFWVAGFDIIYAAQDIDFDRKEGICSVVARFGIAGGLWIARGLHLASAFFLWLFGMQNALGPIYFATVAVMALGLGWEHRLVRPDDLSKVNAAFFNVNGVISLLFFFGILLEWIARFQ